MAPEVGGGGVTMQEDNRVSVSHLNIGHLLPQNLLMLFLIGKCCAHQKKFLFFLQLLTWSYVRPVDQSQMVSHSGPCAVPLSRGASRSHYVCECLLTRSIAGRDVSVY